MEYKHLKSQSLKASLLKFIARMLGLNKFLRKKLDSGDFSKRWVPEPPKNFYKEFNVSTDKIVGHSVFTIAPKKNNCGKYILYLHGGAYVNSFVKQHWDLIAEIVKRTNATLIVPDYPLAPKYTYVDTVKMAENVFEELLIKIAPKDLIFMGDSAGAGLALTLAQKLKIDGRQQPNNIILLSPWLDISTSNIEAIEIEKYDILLNIESLQLAGKLYAGNEDPKNYLMSPIFGSFEGLGKISIFIGTHDLLYPDCIRLKNKLKESKMSFNFFEYPKMFHVWMLFIGLKESKSVLKQIVTLIEQ